MSFVVGPHHARRIRPVGDLSTDIIDAGSPA
jgi:hypothetical protein